MSHRLGMTIPAALEDNKRVCQGLAGTVIVGMSPQIPSAVYWALPQAPRYVTSKHRSYFTLEDNSHQRNILTSEICLEGRGCPLPRSEGSTGRRHTLQRQPEQGARSLLIPGFSEFPFPNRRQAFVLQEVHNTLNSRSSCLVLIQINKR